MRIWRSRLAMSRPLDELMQMPVKYGGDLPSKLHLFEWDSQGKCFIFSYHSLFETSQTLFWAAFGLIDLDNFELIGIKGFTRFWGLLMFGSYSVINIVVLINLLIAMMNHSYQLISVSSVSWPFSYRKSRLFPITFSLSWAFACRQL